MKYYPLNLNISGKCCVVIGGGTVAWRKVQSLVDCDARVTVISPEVHPEIAFLAEQNRLVWKQKRYCSGDLQGAVLVFAATDVPDVQQEIAKEARQRGVLLNNATVPEHCDFHVPAQVRRGDLLLTVSTSGGSPAISRVIRQQLESQFGGEYGEAIYLFACLREQLLAISDDSAKNKAMFTELLATDIFHFMKNRQWQNVAEVIAKIFPAQIEASRVLKRVIDFVAQTPCSEQNNIQREKP